MHRRRSLAAARKTAGYTQESLAAALGIDRSTVNRWEAGKNDPLPYLRPKLARLLGRSTQQLQELIGDNRADLEVAPEVVDLDKAVDWLDHCCGWSPGTSRRKIVNALKGVDRRALVDRSSRRAKMRRSVVADHLAAYYLDPSSNSYLYRARCGSNSLTTSIISQNEWRDLALPLDSAHELFALAYPVDASTPSIDEVGATHAVRRLAESTLTKVRLVDSPIYRLMSVDAQPNKISGRLGLASFVEYALTVDLLEGELFEALANGSATSRGSLPLRDSYLPDLEAVLDFPGRLCAGGTVALCAIARPADGYRDADYLLLVQERSAQVLNAARQLSVVPKGFHKPLADYRAEAQVSATLRRELEEELFGREDIDGTLSRHMSASPMHPTRLSEPMRWLSDTSGAMRMECTSFGLNLVSGNYEFATLVVIDDEEFWRRFGGGIEANWESSGLRLFSSLDREVIERLIFDERWSNEGLFAFLQGIQRLAALGGSRVDLPSIEIY